MEVENDEDPLILAWKADNPIVYCQPLETQPIRLTTVGVASSSIEDVWTSFTHLYIYSFH